MSILVTGATGFVGQRLLKALAKRDVEIKIVSRKAQPKDSKYESLIIDLSKESLDVNDLKGVNTVFHLASYTHDLRDPKKFKQIYESTNLLATERLAKISIEARVNRFIYISSTKAGEANVGSNSLPIDHNHSPQGIYGRTKRDAELKLLNLSKNSEMSVTILRPPLIYGPEMKGNLKKMLKGMNEGWFPRFPEMNNKRSMIHVDDLVRAILFIENNAASYGEIYIATDGEKYSIQDIQKILLMTLKKRKRNWTIPLTSIKLLSYLSASFKYKINKLISDEYYSSKKLRDLGFNPKLKLHDINEKIF